MNLASKRNGFTLIEILIALSIISLLTGILVSSFNSNVALRSKAMSIISTSEIIISSLQDIHRSTGVPNTVVNVEFPLANNSSLDVLVYGEGFVKSGYKNAYIDSATPLIRNQLRVIQEPDAGVSSGLYQISKATVEVRASVSTDGKVGDIYFSRLTKELIQEISEIKNQEFSPAGNSSGSFIYGNTSSGSAFAAFPFDPRPSDRN